MKKIMMMVVVAMMVVGMEFFAVAGGSDAGGDGDKPSLPFFLEGTCPIINMDRVLVKEDWSFKEPIFIYFELPPLLCVKKATMVIMGSVGGGENTSFSTPLKYKYYTNRDLIVWGGIIPPHVGEYMLLVFLTSNDGLVAVGSKKFSVR